MPEVEAIRPGPERNFMPATHLALFRGINVGGKNMLPMKDLAAIFAAARAEDVRTFIQSGNVLFNAEPKNAPDISGRVLATVKKRFGIEPPIVLRTSAQMRGVVKGNPYLDEPESERLYVMFLADRPKAASVKGLDPNRSPSDRYTVVGTEIFMHLATGAAKTKLTNAYFDSKLATISTSRNWRTTTKLLELMTG
jgi:uncharacterized protein (DUF1697 family)